MSCASPWRSFVLDGEGAGTAKGLATVARTSMCSPLLEAKSLCIPARDLATAVRPPAASRALACVFEDKNSRCHADTVDSIIPSFQEYVLGSLRKRKERVEPRELSCLRAGLEASRALKPSSDSTAAQSCGFFPRSRTGQPHCRCSAGTLGALHGRSANEVQYTSALMV